MPAARRILFFPQVGRRTHGKSHCAFRDYPYLDKVVAAGAEKVQDVTEIPGMVTFAQFRDPAGNVIGLVKSEG